MGYLLSNPAGASCYYVANFRVGSTATARTLLLLGGQLCGQHHEVTPEILEDYETRLIVHTVRNPFDIMVSYWYQKSSGNPFNTFLGWVCEGKHPSLKPGALFYDGDNDYVMRFETLQRDFNGLLKLLEFAPTKLVSKTTLRPKNLSYKVMYTPDTKAMVEKAFAAELERYGYSFNG